MNRIPQLYGNPKVHKDCSTVVPFRPVNSQCGSLSAAASKFVDFYLKKLIPYVPGHIKNSYEVILKLKNINFKDGNTRIFTSDAVAMYPNILTDEGINACKKYFDLYAKECKSYFPSALIIKLLKLIMTLNVFEFGNTYWVQKDGTAVGTPCACNYATIVFAYYERTSIIPHFKQNLLLYLRYIDDIFVVWKDLESDPNAFDRFKNELDNQCNLTWITEDRSYKTNFLDLTIEVDRYTNSFTTRTYQKASNLFLYIPAHSAHPPGLIKGLVYGFKNPAGAKTFKSNYEKIVKLLFKRFLNHGYEDKISTPVFNEAAM